MQLVWLRAKPEKGGEQSTKDIEVSKFVFLGAGAKKGGTFTCEVTATALQVLQVLIGGRVRSPRRTLR